MDEKDLWDALDGLHAYDAGFLDSGIHDEDLEQRVIDHLSEELDPTEFRLTIARFLREHYLSEDALAQGYGAEDMMDFLEWLHDELGIDLGERGDL